LRRTLRATRGELPEGLGRRVQAREAFEWALALADGAAEQRLLHRRLRSLDR
jgi:predicted RNA polymerase sigma factor